MPEKWTGNLIGRMHNEGVTQKELAYELNLTRPYVSMILNSTRTPAGAKERFEAAYKAIIDRR